MLNATSIEIVSPLKTHLCCRCFYFSITGSSKEVGKVREWSKIQSSHTSVRKKGEKIENVTIVKNFSSFLYFFFLIWWHIGKWSRNREEVTEKNRKLSYGKINLLLWDLIPENCFLFSCRSPVVNFDTLFQTYL